MALLDSRGRELQLGGPSTDQLQETIAHQDYHLSELKERMAELELAMEDQGWRQLVVGGLREFSRAGLRDIVRMSRLMYLKNPLIKRMVEIQALYVWGRGVTIAAKDPLVNEVVQDFLDDPKNQAELTSHVSRRQKEVDLNVMGNIFFVFFPNPSTGETRVRSIPMDEITEIICDPEDAKSPWFYRREWEVLTYDERGGIRRETRKELYADWGHRPTTQSKMMYGCPVHWDTPVYHLKVGGLSDMLFGVPETYAAMDWAKAYKEFLEDWCTITRAYARFAWRMQTVGQRGVTAAKAKFGTTLATGANESTIETNPTPNVGGMFIGTDKAKLEPIKTSGATTSADDGRRIFLMVAAAGGWAETFFGDASVGTVATATSLDRPTELKVLDRQTLWAEALQRILDFVIDRNAESTGGKLAGKALVKNRANDGRVVPIKPKAGTELDRFIDVKFPDVLEHSILDRIQALVLGATLGNKQGQLAGTIDLKTLAKMILTELGATEIDEIIDALFPEGEEVPTGKERQLALDPAGNGGPGGANPAAGGPEQDLGRSATESAHLSEAARELRDSLKQFQEKYSRAA